MKSLGVMPLGVMPLGVMLLCMLAATVGCQPSANRLLLLDMSLSDPLVVEAVATPWHEAGYRVEYRRFYPHLTRADLARYRTLVIIGGREPERLSDALTLGDLAILHEWVGGSVRRGREGVVVLAYTSDGRNPAGSLDRWTMNQWLASLGAGIRIGETPPLGAPAVPLPRSSLDNAGFAAFPAGRNQTLQVRDPTQILARAPEGGSNAAFVAASRMNDGLIVVVGREFLASASDDSRTHDYLLALARWTRRPAEWAQVGAATGRSLLQLAEPPGGGRLAQHPPPLTPPADAGVTMLPAPATPLAELADKPPVPNWIARQGMRVFWTRFALHQLDSVLDFADVTALNALATVVPMPAIIDTVSTRYLWRNAAERFRTTSVRWFPAVALFELPTEAEEVDRHGELQPVPCGLDSALWRGALRSTYRTLARLGTIGVDAEARARRGGRLVAPARADVVAGVALDLDSAAAYYRGTGFCDVDYRTGLAALGLDSAETERLAILPPTLRYDTLLERGFLARYYDALQAATTERARALRAELQRLRPDLRFAFRSDELPGDWFSLGLLQGFSSAETPVLLWLGERRAGELLARYRARGVYAISALRLEPDHDTFAPGGWNRLRPVVFNEHSGFWLDRAVPDTIARMIRRTSR